VASLTIQYEDGDPGPAGRGRRRSIALCLDGKAWLRVEPDAFLELDLAAGSELDEAQQAAVEQSLARVRARRFLIRSLAVRAQSTAELERKLASRGIPADVARDALERVAGFGYIDDAALSSQLARGMLTRGYGRRRAEQKLRSRGLPGALVEWAIDEAYGTDDEADLARAALGRRPVADDADRRRAVAYLARRGFTSAAAWKAVRDAAGEL
jgi:regulatory protein